MRLKYMVKHEKREGKGIKKSRNESSNIIIKYLNEKK